MVLILEIAAAIAGYGMKNNIERNVEENMKRTMLEYNDNKYAAESWDFLQERVSYPDRNFSFIEVVSEFFVFRKTFLFWVKNVLICFNGFC